MCFIANLPNLLTRMFLLLSYLPAANLPILHGLTRKFCVQSNLSTKWAKYKITRQPSDYQQYALQHNPVTTLVRNARMKYENNIASKVQTNPKLFWAFNQLRLNKHACDRRQYNY